MRYMLFFKILILSLMMTGCATYKMTLPAPVKSDDINIEYNDKPLSGWNELPLGAYRVPDSQVIITGHQKGAAAGLLFGVVGVAVADAVNTAVGKATVENLERSLQISLTTQAQTVTRRMIFEKGLENRFSTSQDHTEQTLSVSSAVIITFINDIEVRPYVQLKAELIDNRSSKTIWSTRYIASTGKPHRLAGNDSYTFDDGALLKSNITTALEHAIEFMLKDAASPLSRDDTELTMMQSYFPYLKQKVESVGYLVSEDVESIVFIPKIGDASLLAGVHIIDKSVTIFRDATENDSYFKIVGTP